MASWVEDEARSLAIYMRDVSELWRTIQDRIDVAITDWKRIYRLNNTEEIERSECSPYSERCFRVRTIPNVGEKEYYVKVSFDFEGQSIQLSGPLFKNTASFKISVSQDKLTIAAVDTPAATITVEQLSRLILSPLLNTFGFREPRHLLI